MKIMRLFLCKLSFIDLTCQGNNAACDSLGRIGVSVIRASWKENPVFVGIWSYLHESWPITSFVYCL